MKRNRSFSELCSRSTPNCTNLSFDTFPFFFHLLFKIFFSLLSSFLFTLSESGQEVAANHTNFRLMGTFDSIVSGSMCAIDVIDLPSFLGIEDQFLLPLFRRFRLGHAARFTVFSVCFRVRLNGTRCWWTKINSHTHQHAHVLRIVIRVASGHTIRSRSHAERHFHITSRFFDN